MQWNWQHQNWPEFVYDSDKIETLETQFQKDSGVIIGVLKHIDSDAKNDLVIDLISTEAINTSRIEGEILNRDSVQSSIKRNFGLGSSTARITPAEQGIADMMTDLYQTWANPLTHSMLFQWHKMLTNGRTDLNDIGRYRTHEEPMQIISGADYAAKVHFEAPPSSTVKDQMDKYIEWYNASHDLPPLTRASIAHLYFESIHPFEDGNGRIGRALVEKALSQQLEQSAILALSHTIQENKKAYYSNLEVSNQDLEITKWLEYFSQVILDAQANALRLIEFLIAKTKHYDRYKDAMNERQAKAVERMFREGPNGFKGGLSAENYISITGAKRPTATRDLTDLVNKNILKKTGERRYTRYWLPMVEIEGAET
ncbi:MAG: Fic family protein [Rhizobiaceae bacterium]|nr:Fic family protein [Rhizobiaceae bacterium]